MNCKLCGERDLPLFYTQGNEDQFRFYRCRRCTLVLYDTTNGVSQEKYVMSRIDPDAATRQNRGHRQTYAFIRRQRPSPGRMLDLGCGDGIVLHLARQDGWQVHGVELFPEQVALVRETLGLDVETSDIAGFRGAPESWDVVILAHVLEHLADPVGALRKIRDLLAPGGIGVLEFPNIDALDGKVRRALRRWHLHRHRYRSDYVPGHVQEFCRASFAFAAQQAGLVLAHWETYAVNPLKYFVYRYLPLGNKARVLVQRAIS
jgi:SAM-dependent methyltransferase